MTIALERREKKNGHRGGVLWFTGFSGAGKTTLARALEEALFARGMQVVVLDGDMLRQKLCCDLGFSPEARQENARRAGEVAAMFAGAGFIVIGAFIMPTEHDREIARAAFPRNFHVVHIATDLATCEKRDVKGLYKKARSGEITDFTGISAPYERPSAPALSIDTAGKSVDECVAQLVAFIEKHFVQAMA